MDTMIPSNTNTITTEGARRGLLSLPRELRDMIYRLLFCYQTVAKYENEDADGYESCDSDNALPLTIKKRVRLTVIKEDDWHMHQLSGQLLRTCWAIHDEGLAILYGENLWRVGISNTYGRSDYHRGCPPVLRHVFNGPWYSEWARSSIMPHLTRFSIVIRYTEKHKLAALREMIRFWTKRLREVPRIKSLHLEYNIDCDDAYLDPGRHSHRHWLPSRDPGQYPVNNEARSEAIYAIQTWVSRLRNVEQVVIEGLPKANADTIRERWMSKEPLEKTPLTEMYAVLERHVLGAGFCEDKLRNALLAAERDDMEGFKKHRAVILDDFKERIEKMQEEMVLHDPKED